MKTAYIKNSTAKCLLLFVVISPIVALLVGGPLWFLSGLLFDPKFSEDFPVWGWAILLFFGIFALLVVKGWLFYLTSAFGSKPRLIIDQNGITENFLGVGLIDWQDIGEITFEQKGAGRTLNLYISDVGKYVSRMSVFTKIWYKILYVFNSNIIPLFLNGVEGSPDAVVQLINQYQTIASNMKRNA